jgi:hypothetical protein
MLTPMFDPTSLNTQLYNYKVRIVFDRKFEVHENEINIYFWMRLEIFRNSNCDPCNWYLNF